MTQDSKNQEHERSLSDLSLEELWGLFPISLVRPKEAWQGQYQRMEAKLESLLGGSARIRSSHIGSTSIPSIMAKDIVDILIEVDEGEALDPLARQLEEAGFIRMADNPQRIDLNLGYTPDGFAEEVFHIHLRRWGDNDELYFRDYLREHPDVASEYECLKLDLWKRYEHDRDAYTDAKTAFVHAITDEARRSYGNRY